MRGLQALGRAHRQLVNSNWRGVALKEIVRSSLEPFGARIDMDGADIIFGAKETQDFSLVIHELATNAVKYGALSVPKGRVVLSWRIYREHSPHRLIVTWRELDGPVVSPDAKTGFGTTLIRRAIRGARVEHGLEPGGVVCTLELDLRGLRSG